MYNIYLEAVMRIPYNAIFNFIDRTCKFYNIDESHGLRHSMEVLRFSKNILNEELHIMPSLEEKQHIIYTSALLHDMCDSKYMDQNTGLDNISCFLQTNKYSTSDINEIRQIMSTMSYSKIKDSGFPHYKDKVTERAFHIVRESDILCAYDVERCMLYELHKKGGTIENSINHANTLFNERMFKHYDDKLFITQYGLREGRVLHVKSKQRIREYIELFS